MRRDRRAPMAGAIVAGAIVLVVAWYGARRQQPGPPAPVSDAGDLAAVAPASSQVPDSSRLAPAPSISRAQTGALAEAWLMAQLRQAANSDPARAVLLAREGNRRFPESTDAPERTSILIHALASQGLASEARGEAEDMVNRYPDSTWVREIESFTGAHRHRNVTVSDAGALIYR